MVTWHEFVVAEPELAEAGRSLLFQFGVGLAFLATVRKDGAPPSSPVPRRVERPPVCSDHSDVPQAL